MVGLRMDREKAKKLMTMFLSFFKIGAFTIGGGYAMLPLIEKEFVEKQGWVSHEEMVDILALVQSVPGVIAINSSIFIGYKVAGVPGALAAAAGMIIPSFVTILVIAMLFINVQDNQYVQKAFAGVRSGVTALILLAAVKLGKSVIKDLFSVLIAAAAFIALVVFDLHAIIVILLSAVLGFLWYSLAKARRSL